MSPLKVPVVSGDNDTWGTKLNAYFGGLTGYNIANIEGTILDGSTDDSAVINAFMAANPPGTLFLPRGTVLGKNFDLRSNWQLVGEGPNVSHLKLHPSAGAGDDLVRAEGFNTNSGTTNNAGAVHTALRRLHLDGNKANAPSSRHVVAYYGNSLVVEDVVANNYKGSFWLEFGQFVSGVTGGQGDYRNVIRNLGLNGMDTATLLPTSEDVAVMTSASTGAAISTTAWSAGSLTVTTHNRHKLLANQSITIAGVTPSGVNGTWTIATVPTTTTFTIVMSDPGAYVSGGTITYRPSSALAILGTGDFQFSDIVIYQESGTIVPGQHGMTIGAHSSGGKISGLHIYLNFDTGFDARASATTIDGMYVGGQNVCVRNRGNGNMYRGRIETGFANSIGFDQHSVGGGNEVDLTMAELGNNSTYLRLNGAARNTYIARVNGSGTFTGATLYELRVGVASIPTTNHGHIVGANANNVAASPADWTN